MTLDDARIVLEDSGTAFLRAQDASGRAWTVYAEAKSSYAETEAAVDRAREVYYQARSTVRHARSEHND